MATEFRLKHPTTGEEKAGYTGYSWTCLCFGGFPALFRGDILIGLGILFNRHRRGIAVFAIGWPTWVSSGVIGGIWGCFYNRIHLKRLLSAGYAIYADAVVEFT